MKKTYPRIIITTLTASLGIFLISWSLATAWTNPALPPVGSSGSLYASPLGNIGIGVSSPAHRLDVAGNVRWSGSLTGGSVGWSNLSAFPAPCPAGTFVVLLGDTPSCLSAAWTGLTSIPAGFADGVDNTGGVSSITAGVGIITSPAPITTTGSISADTNYSQRRVSGTCAGGAISGVNADGTVTCKALPAPLPCTWGVKTHAAGAICFAGGVRSVCLGSPNYDSAWLFQCNANGTWSYYPASTGVTNNCTRPTPAPRCNI